MGTPDFAVASLDTLVKAGCDIAGVVTAPDKPAGRGLELQASPVKKYALEKGLKVFQPEKLKDEKFLAELRALNADLQIVVAFRMLPEAVWAMPKLGTFNLHASLLPRYRGAAPINRAVMNGDRETGVTTFFLQHEIDTGKIIFREAVSIGPDETAGELHDRLMATGAQLVLKTVQAIASGNYPQTPQSEFTKAGEALPAAPKIFREDCRIDWSKTAQEVHNFIRGLSPYPAAFTDLVSPDGKTHSIKIYRSSIAGDKPGAGKVIADRGELLIGTAGGAIRIEELQLAGKKKMATAELLRGFAVTSEWEAK